VFLEEVADDIIAIDSCSGIRITFISATQFPFIEVEDLEMRIGLADNIRRISGESNSKEGHGGM
jgi:hypothetical protein